MLPKYLKIKGFRSYIDTEIDFTQFGDMFCVIGQNGAGKSSIIDTCLPTILLKSVDLPTFGLPTNATVGNFIISPPIQPLL